MTTKAVCLAALLALTSSASLADQPASREALKRFCTGDYFDHCGQFAPDGPEVQACFREKRALLTPNCSLAITAYQQEQKPAASIRTTSATR